MGDDLSGTKTTERKASKQGVDKFGTLLKKLEPNTKIALFTHSFPDPDAIGSMMGLNWMLSKVYGLESDIFYTGEISHPQNNAIYNLLDPQMKRVEEVYKAENYGFNILVDTIPINAGTGDKQVNFDLVIDHHKDLPNGGYNGLVINFKTGSCCAIVFHIMQTLCKDICWFEDNNDQDSKVATAILAGIITDTEYMVSPDTTEMEVDAFIKLLPFRNPNFLREIVFYKRPKFWIDVEAEAAKNALTDTEGYSTVFLGQIPTSQRDIIAAIAEKMTLWASVHTAIAFAVVDDQVTGSVRSSNSSISVPDLCKKLGGKNGSGGGKLGAGAYRYSLGALCIDKDDNPELRSQTLEFIKNKEACRIRKIVSQ